MSVEKPLQPWQVRLRNRTNYMNGHLPPIELIEFLEERIGSVHPHYVEDLCHRCRSRGWVTLDRDHHQYSLIEGVTAEELFNADKAERGHGL